MIEVSNANLYYRKEDGTYGLILGNPERTITKGTLSAGDTTITLSDSNIKENSALSFYTSIYGLSPTEVSTSAGSVTLTFDAQESDIEVGVRVDG